MIPEPIVITGIGLVTALGNERESSWNALRAGRVGFQRTSEIPELRGEEICVARVDLPSPVSGRLKAFTLCERAADEAVADAALDWEQIDRTQFGCSINGIMGDCHFKRLESGQAVEDAQRYPWWEQMLPNTMCAIVANRFGLEGPRLSHSTACASSLISFLAAVRAIRDGQCDIALAGGGDAIDSLFVAGFKQMKAMSDEVDPQTACRPFDRNRRGFVMGEGAGVFVVERLGHALRRGAKIYGEVRAGRMLAEAHHVTGLDAQSESLTQLIAFTLDSAGLEPHEIGYINAHGTGTHQNDLVEMRSIRNVFGSCLEKVCVSATKSMLGHTINGAGAVELAVTALAMRDGFAPPTMNHTDPDPECVFDCLPQSGRLNRFQHALKLSIAFGGHLVAVALSRWNDPQHGFDYPDLAADGTRRNAA
jgi:3-oxoacyl-(acyl-carrier-protein) synthase